MKKLFFSLSLAVFLFGSCAKDTVYLEAGTTNETSGTTVTSLEGTKWKMAALILGQEINGVKSEADLLPSTGTCAKDDILFFDKNDVFLYDEGPSKCEDSDPQQEIGSWSLSSDKKKLTLVSPIINNSDEAQVYSVSMDGEKLKLYASGTVDTDVNGQNVKTTIYTIFILAPYK